MKLGDVTELEPLSEAIRDFSEAAREANSKFFLAGALARDLWLLYGNRDPESALSLLVSFRSGVESRR